MKKILGLSSVLVMTLAVFANTGCNSSGESASGGTSTATTSYTYTSTSSKGDMVNWTVTGTAVSLVWNVTDTSGAIKYTWNITANQTAFDSAYSFGTYLIQDSSCMAGNTACPGGTPNGSFHMMEVPGTALIVHVPSGVASASDGGSNDELHIGFVSGGCPGNVAGDYVYIRAGRANASYDGKDVIGIYRTNATFTSINHNEFGMNGANSNALAATYTTSSGNPTGAETPTNGGCSNGVFTRGIGGGTMRLNLTSSGMFIMDMPSGQGGLISFKTTAAAAIADVASKSWSGLAFPDNGGASPMSMTTGSVSSGSVSLAGSFMPGSSMGNSMGTLSGTVTPVSDASLATKFAAPAAYTSSTSPLLGSYAAPANIPGVFEIGTGGGDANVVAIASKIGSKVLMFGTVYNWRHADGSGCGSGNPATPSDGTCLIRNSGNFLLFSK